MVKNRRLAKSISDAGWSSFGSILSYKASWRGRTLQKVDGFFPSSKLCADCGAKNVNLKLSDREWVCEGCGVVHDRDENAAVNIENESLRMFSEISIDAQGVACALRTQSGCKTPGFHPGASCVEASNKIGFLWFAIDPATMWRGPEAEEGEIKVIDVPSSAHILDFIHAQEEDVNLN